MPRRQTFRRWRFYGSIALAVCLAVIGLPVAVYLAAQQLSMTIERNIAAGYAQDVLVRSERMSRSLRQGFAILEARRGAGPCAQASVDAMRQITLMFPEFVAAGYLQGDRLLCSSLPFPDRAISLGEADFHGQFNVRTRVTLPYAPKASLMAVERDGYVLFIFPSHVMDIPIDSRAVVATYSTIARRIRTSRGRISQAWIAAGERGRERTFIDGGFAVAVVESKTYPTGVVVAYPLQIREWTWRELVTAVTALAIVAGVGVATWILFVARGMLGVSGLSLRRALRKGEFELFYQPIVDLETRQWVGAEALLRWQRADGRSEDPALFVPVAERQGLSRRLTARVLELAARDAAAFFAARQGFFLALNLAAGDLESPDLVAQLKNTLLSGTGADAGSFHVEITEHSLLSASLADGAIEAIRALGMRVVIDDFGTGFSNLRYLASYPLDGLKIDRYFVQMADRTGPAREVVLHMIDLAESLHLHIVAEGIETEAQAETLRAHGVRMGQGWLFARAQDAQSLLRGLVASPSGTGAPARHDPAQAAPGQDGQPRR
ncbi:EAL domain-containing protein [Luteimonas aquatica]|uniref:EAL domain-containing protein n=1 Tax=Luteimonas aquatica TaxID=450364 RepID=UPI001F595609|nr:EAL domain-containing protein [Luteimonas aquatica]